MRFLLKRAPLGALFIGLIFPSLVLGDCKLKPDQSGIQAVQVETVFDGDTVKLVDGRRIRLLGVNTPEVAHGKQKEEPFARGASDLLQSLVTKSPLYLLQGQDGLDHYGRVLGHLFTAQGDNVSAEMLVHGFGFVVVIPPNLGYADCYMQAENAARKQGLGVWSSPYYQPVDSASDNLKGGYIRIAGRVEKVTLTKKVVWVDLVGHVTLKLEKRYLEHLDGELFDQIVSASNDAHPQLDIEVQGWLSDRLTWRGKTPELVRQGKRKRFQMKIQHHSSWRAVNMLKVGA